MGTRKISPLTCNYVGQPIGIEPMTYALRGTCDLAAHALAAPMAPVIALMALAALGLSGNSVHKPVHEQEAVARPSERLTPWVLEDWRHLNGFGPVGRRVTLSHGQG